MPQRIYKKVGIAAIIMMASVLFSRIIGLLREVVIAYVGGATAEVDAYQVSFIIPEILNHIVASGFLSVTFIPIFAKHLARGDEEEGWRVFSIILTCCGALLILMTLFFWVVANQLVALAAPGRSSLAFQSTAVQMTRIIIPAQFFFFSGGLFMAVQFAKEKFAIPALAPLIYNLGIIVGGLVLGGRFGMVGFSWGVLAGAFVGNFALQYWGAKRVGMKYTIQFSVTHPDFKKYILLTLPLMFGLTLMFSLEIFMRYFGSFLPPGGIAGLNYSRVILFILVGLFGQAVGVASFPFMARLAAEDRMVELNRLMNQTLRYLSLVIPCSVLLMVLRYEVVRILFQRGRFDIVATELTAQILVYMLVGAFALSAYTVIVRGYYALQNTLYPAVFGTLAVLASLPLYWFGMKWLAAPGIALAISISFIFQAALLYALWNRRSQNREGRQVYGIYLKMAVISLMLGVALEACKRFCLHSLDVQTLIGSSAMVVIIGGIFICLLLAAGYAFKITEIVNLARRTVSRLADLIPN